MRRPGRLLAVTLVLAWIGAADADTPRPVPTPLRLAVMDPLAEKLACACVKGYAQRKYDRLAAVLAQQLGRPVQIGHGESLTAVRVELEGPPALICGPDTVVRAEAAEEGLSLRVLARLTDLQGRTTLTGLFVVRANDRARTLTDLKGRTIVLGPVSAEEKHGAARRALARAGVPLPTPPRIASGCSTAALAVVEEEADAAVISSYALPLLEGCQKVEKGALRVVGETEPVPFVTLFATAVLPADLEERVVAALVAVRSDPDLRAALESRDGFLRPGEATTAPASQSAGAPASAPAAGRGWPDWRGPHRDGLTPDLPTTLPEKPDVLWRQPLTGTGLSGVTATAELVVVSDKDPSGERDVWRCFDARSGAPRWTVEYAAPGKLDYGNAPRAAAVLHDGRAYLLGAFGHLHCVELATGTILWRRHLVEDFQAPLATWGYSSTPLVVDDLLIVNPGAPDAALVALERRTGATRWRSPGHPAAYASFVPATLGGVRQIVGYDAEGLGGWDPATGRRLWELVPDEQDFNVPTPIVLDGRLLVATENNGTRLYAFDERGRIRPEPVARTRALRPDTSTPVVVNGLVFGCAGELVCLDPAQGLKTLWFSADELFSDYCTLLGGNGHVLVCNTDGVLVLVKADRTAYRPVAQLKVFDEADMWAHPALVGDRLYLRDRRELVCLRLPPP